MLFLELFVAFLVVCLVFVQAADLWLNYQKPLGFSYENRWVIQMDPRQGESFHWDEENTARLEQIFMTTRQMDGVLDVAGVDMVPFEYSIWTWGDSIPLLGKYVSVEISNVTDEFARTMDLEIINGRWFSEADNAALYSPVVINRRYAETAFPGEDPIGRHVLPVEREGLPPEDLEELETQKVKQVVGVVEDYRKQGELRPLNNFALLRSSPMEPMGDSTKLFNAENSPPRNLLVKVVPENMNAAFEEAIIDRLENIMPAWSFKAKPLTDFRSARIKNTITPFVSFGLIAGFLVLMVALGLIGVVWQNVSSRFSELGLRRALGASKKHIFAQVLGELFMLVSMSLALGSFVVAQFPLLGLIKEIPTEAYLLGWATAMLFLLMVTFVCGFYPSRVAIQVHPTRALQEE